MVNLFLTEVLKLKRSSMFLISILGAAVAPFVVVIATYLNEPSILFKELFYNVNLYTVLIIGVPFMVWLLPIFSIANIWKIH